MKSSNVDYRRQRVSERGVVGGQHGAAVTRTGIGVATLKTIIALLPSLAVYIQLSDRESQANTQFRLTRHYITHYDLTI